MRQVVALSVALLAAGCGRSTDDWLRQLKDADVVKRREAVRELSSMSSEAANVAGRIDGVAEESDSSRSYRSHGSALPR